MERNSHADVIYRVENQSVRKLRQVEAHEERHTPRIVDNCKIWPIIVMLPLVICVVMSPVCKPIIERNGTIPFHEDILVSHDCIADTVSFVFYSTKL